MKKHFTSSHVSKRLETHMTATLPNPASWKGSRVNSGVWFDRQLRYKNCLCRWALRNKQDISYYGGGGAITEIPNPSRRSLYTLQLRLLKNIHYLMYYSLLLYVQKAFSDIHEILNVYKCTTLFWIHSKLMSVRILVCPCLWVGPWDTLDCHSGPWRDPRTLVRLVRPLDSLQILFYYTIIVSHI